MFILNPSIHWTPAILILALKSLPHNSHFTLSLSHRSVTVTKGMASGRFSAAYKKDNDKKDTRSKFYLQDFFDSIGSFTFQFRPFL